MLLLTEKTIALRDYELEQWVKKLSKISNLIAFHEAVTDLQEDSTYHERIDNWLQVNKQIFLALGNKYTKKKEVFYSTFFAYLVWHYKLCTGENSDKFVLLMHELCVSPSLYCRENALCALYASGKATHVVKAYVLLTQRNIEHSSKMVTDGLLQFSGDKEALAQELWESWDTFPPYYQICFINFIRMVSGSFTERFYNILIEGNADKEVQYAAIRYFRTHKYEPAAKLLQKLVSQWRKRDWEYAAIAALSLENYESPASVYALVEGCHSTSWHVRENSSDSLIQMIHAPSVKGLDLNIKDKYAKEMLQYKLLKKEEIDTK